MPHICGEMNMPYASEAFTQSCSVVTKNKESLLLTKIKAQIIHASNNGEYLIIIDSSISYTTISLLRQLGYKVENINNKVNLSWDLDEDKEEDPDIFTNFFISTLEEFTADSEISVLYMENYFAKNHPDIDFIKLLHDVIKRCRVIAYSVENTIVKCLKVNK